MPNLRYAAITLLAATVAGVTLLMGGHLVRRATAGSGLAVGLQGKNAHRRTPLERLRLRRAWWFQEKCSPCWLAAFSPGNREIYLFAGGGPARVPRGAFQLPKPLTPLPASAGFLSWQLMPVISADRQLFGAIFKNRGGRRAVAVWSLSKPRGPKILYLPNTVDTTVYALSFSPRNRLLAAGYRGAIFIWNRRTGHLKEVLKAGGWRPPLSPRAIVFLRGNRLAAAVGGWVLCWDYKTGRLLYRAKVATLAGVPLEPENSGRNMRGSIESMVSVRHRTVLACGWGVSWPSATITFCDASNGRPIRNIRLFSPQMRGVAKDCSVACMEPVSGNRLVVGIMHGFKFMGRVAIVADRSGRILALSRRVVGGCFYVSAARKGPWVLSAGFLGVRLWRAGR